MEKTMLNLLIIKASDKVTRISYSDLVQKIKQRATEEEKKQLMKEKIGFDKIKKAMLENGYKMEKTSCSICGTYFKKK